MGKFQYALWTETSECIIDVRIFDSEEEAARSAFEVHQYTDGLVYGLQRSDGALCKAADWPAYQELLANPPSYAEFVAEPVSQKRIFSPFAPGERHYAAWVEADTPSWVGAGETGDRT